MVVGTVPTATAPAAQGDALLEEVEELLLVRGHDVFSLVLSPRTLAADIPEALAAARARAAHLLAVLRGVTTGPASSLALQVIRADDGVTLHECLIDGPSTLDATRTTADAVVAAILGVIRQRTQVQVPQRLLRTMQTEPRVYKISASLAAGLATGARSPGVAMRVWLVEEHRASRDMPLRRPGSPRAEDNDAGLREHARVTRVAGLGFMETRTAAIVARDLKALGFTVTTGIGGTGVVGVLRNGDGPVVMYRADMDANAVEEATGLPYASKVRVKRPDGAEVPVGHICGHDAHVTWMLGMAKALTGMKSSWKGTVVLAPVIGSSAG